MALIEFVCEKCGEKFDELIRDDSEREKVACPKCGAAATQSFSGKCYGAIGKSSGGCSGNCGGCSGCH